MQTNLHAGTTILVRRAALGATAASAINLGVFAAARMKWGVPDGFLFLNPVSIVVATTFAFAIAALGLAAFVRLTRNANIAFVIALAVATLLSLAGPLQAMAGGMPGAPRATLATGTTMIALHFLTAGVIAVALLRPHGGR